MVERGSQRKIVPPSHIPLSLLSAYVTCSRLRHMLMWASATYQDCSHRKINLSVSSLCYVLFELLVFDSSSETNNKKDSLTSASYLLYSWPLNDLQSGTNKILLERNVYLCLWFWTENLIKLHTLVKKIPWPSAYPTYHKLAEKML